MLSLTKQDYELIRELRQADVFCDIASYRLDQANGAILIVCSDGDQFSDVFHHQEKLQLNGHRVRPRVHTFAWHGGALACVPCSPINEEEDDHLVFLRQIGAGRAMKDIHVVIARAHAPCGAARKNNVSLTEAISLQFKAKQQIKTLNHGVTAACFFDVDYGSRKRTYFVSKKNWVAWTKEHGIPSVA